LNSIYPSQNERSAMIAAVAPSLSSLMYSIMYLQTALPSEDYRPLLHSPWPIADVSHNWC
jgi:hypothetical protein